MKKGDYISSILRSNKTVFSFKDIALLWGNSNDAARVRVNYYVKNDQLYRIRRGFYAKDKNYDRSELAAKIFTPSYVSFETVLAREGVIFQYYSQIFAASYLTRDIVCDNQTYSYKKIKALVLANNAGVENKEECSIATKERAFLDTIYINKDYHFDNLSPLDWDRVFEMLPMYNNKRMAKKVKEFYED
ncbi:type IV toxin-antitoxin system AbiEi family antitoxin domain-containing protein, partial [bacterium]|nr:type IV toxin-antitoxin system AbiEi family antitoxin domain-containing protein [bacterium]